MKNWEKIGLIVNFIVLVIVVILYMNVRQKNKNLNGEIQDLKNQMKQDEIASVTNYTPAYVPEGMPVADPSENLESEPPQTEFHRNPENVTIEVLEDTITSTSVSISITNKDERILTYGEEFSVEEKVNDEWRRLAYLPDKLITWNAIAYQIKGNSQTTKKINIQNYYGELKKGIYRIVKPIFIGDEIDLYSNEFEIK